VRAASLPATVQEHHTELIKAWWRWGLTHVLRIVKCICRLTTVFQNGTRFPLETTHDESLIVDTTFLS
jgi:hypothetical protein